LTPTARRIAPARGKLGILTPGMGAVATTFYAGVEAVRRGLANPIGSLTQMATIRLGKRTERRAPMIKDFVPLAKLTDIVFGGWDPIPDDAYTAAHKAGVLGYEHQKALKPFLSKIKPMKAVFDQHWVKKLVGTHVKKGRTKRDLAEMLRQDIRDFKKHNKLDRVVAVWCASTEIFLREGAAHRDLKTFEKAMLKNDATIAPSMLYAYAAIMEGVPFANGAPNLCCDVPALEQLAKDKGVAIGGKDFKTGQTMLKTVLAPMFRVQGLARPPFNLVISNVPGPKTPHYFNGARLEGMYPLSIPIHGMALNITCMSYDGNMGFGLTGCRRTVPHLQRLLTHLDDELMALEKAADVA